MEKLKQVLKASLDLQGNDETNDLELDLKNGMTIFLLCWVFLDNLFFVCVP